jgi:hypothetical protein
MPLQHRHTYTAEFGVASPLALSTSFGVAPKGRALQPGPDPSGSSRWNS